MRDFGASREGAEVRTSREAASADLKKLQAGPRLPQFKFLFSKDARR